MRTETTSLTQGFYRAVGKHFVTLSCVQRLDANRTENVILISGFIAEVRGFWFYVTAGHILRDFQKALEAGGDFDVWRLGDQTAGNKFKDIGIPFDFSLGRWIIVEDEETGLDYAATILEDYYRMLLEAGGVVPLTSETWGNQTVDHDHLAVVGIPSETIRYDGKTNISARVVVIPLETADVPVAAGAKSQNQFYANLKADSEGKVNDLKGLSGAPVFAIRKVEDGWKYWVVGVQSGWYRNTRTIVACPFSSFAEALNDVVQSCIEEIEQGKVHNDGAA